MAKPTPEQEASYALSFNVARSDLSQAGQLAYDRLVAEGRTGQTFTTQLPPPKFPSEPEARRQILEAIASRNPKYARPFTKGQVASVSYIGTESWADYGSVVLQMAMLDTLLSIEEKLGKLLGEGTDEDSS